MTRDAVNALTQAGAQKLQLSRSAPGRFFARAAMAGAFIFVGTLLSTLCAAWFYDTSLPVARLLAAVTFSAALTLIVLLGGELFTGCTLVMGVSLYEGKAGAGRHPAGVGAGLGGQLRGDSGALPAAGRLRRQR